MDEIYDIIKANFFLDYLYYQRNVNCEPFDLDLTYSNTQIKAITGLTGGRSPGIVIFIVINLTVL